MILILRLTILSSLPVVRRLFLFAFLSCLNPGDEDYRTGTCLCQLYGIRYLGRAVIRTVTTTIEEGFSLPKVEKFEGLINERTKAILICNEQSYGLFVYAS